MRFMYCTLWAIWFFAGAAELEENLPDPGEATRSTVILTLRDRDEVGSTFINVIKR